MKNQKKWAAVFAIAVILGLFLVRTWVVGKPLIAFASEPALFRDWVDSCGVLGRLAYAGMVIVQVVIALIPGEPFEIAGGYAFGILEGTALYLLAATLGSLLVFLLVRRYGMHLVALFFSKEKLQNLWFLHTDEKRSVLFFLIFMLPGTPKDLLCYYAGLTDLPLGLWLLISSDCLPLLPPRWGEMRWAQKTMALPLQYSFSPWQ